MLTVTNLKSKTPVTVPGWSISSQKRSRLDDCCLIVPTYRRAGEIAKLLQVLAELADQPGELIIADASPDGETERVVRQFAESSPVAFDVLYARCPQGLTRQRNIGIDLSTREFIFFLDDDCEPLDGYFVRLRDVFVQDVERRIGAIGGAVLNEMNRPLNRRWRLRFSLGLVPSGSPLNYYGCGTSVPRGLMEPFQGIRPATVLPGCALAFRCEVLERERFSEFFYGYSQGEDLEMTLRVARRWTVVCCGDAHVLHHHAPAGRPASFSKGRMEIRNKHFIWKRYVQRPSMRDRLRFWGDVYFLIAMDCIWFLAKPYRFAPLGHAAGLFRGMLDSFGRSSEYKEPYPFARYSLRAEQAQ